MPENDFQKFVLPNSEKFAIEKKVDYGILKFEGLAEADVTFGDLSAKGLINAFKDFKKDPPAATIGILQAGAMVLPGIGPVLSFGLGLLSGIFSKPSKSPFKIVSEQIQQVGRQVQALADLTLSGFQKTLEAVSALPDAIEKRLILQNQLQNEAERAAFDRMTVYIELEREKARQTTIFEMSSFDSELESMVVEVGDYRAETLGSVYSEVGDERAQLAGQVAGLLLNPAIDGELEMLEKLQTLHDIRETRKAVQGLDVDLISDSILGIK